MVLTTKEARYIIVLGIVISILSISSTLLQDGYHIRINQKTVNKGEEEPIKHCGSARKKHVQSIYFPTAFPKPFPIPNLIPFPRPFLRPFPRPFPIPFPIPIPRPFPSQHTASSRRAVAVALWSSCEHLSSRYVAQVNLSVSSHICSRIVLGCNVCNCCSTVDSVLDARDQWLWIGEHMTDSWDPELVQMMQDLGESHAVYSEGIVFRISRGLGSQLLLSWTQVDRSSEGDDQSTCQLIVTRASSIVRMNITSKYTFFYSSEMQSPFLRAVELPKQPFESYHILVTRIVIVPAENSDGICDIGLTGSQRVYRASDQRLVYCRITGFFVRCGGHHGGFVHHDLQEDFPLIIPWDSAKEVEDVFLLTHLGDCLCINIGVSSVSVIGCWSCTEIVILDYPIDL